MFPRFAPLAPIAAALLVGCAAPPAPSAPPSAPEAAPAPALVDDAAAAAAALERERAALRAAAGPADGARVQRMVELGMWEDAEAALAEQERHTTALALAEGELRLRQHRYERARERVDAVLSVDPDNRAARLLDARLRVQAWDLPGATAAVEALLREHDRDEEAALLLGRIALLQKRYDDALEWSQRVQQWSPGNAQAHLLEADTRFWAQDPASAEEPLRRALARDPFDPDARFAYGYAIWRRVDATQLDDMAAQWDLALAVDPLHYTTHWHWGNGHTNLTYADYAQPTDSVVRARLATADSLLSTGRIAQAVESARAVQRDFPESSLPGLLRGSAFYLAHGLGGGPWLDSAEVAFREVLRRQPHFGPAHNGLAATIKARQFRVLEQYDSLEAAIAATPTPHDPALADVFPDLPYYPGERVEQMVRQELGPSLAYIPLIHRQQRRYRIPPLHKDLAEVMERPYFRTSTTFDNRQWMDIRGVGSGAAAIEYVERGAHQERKVLLHEFVHLFHGIVLTDAENRRVRELYHDAMREGRTLDYYASNNESEFLAQVYPAFLSPVKVHPLTHKAMNTRADLEQRDPATLAFVDSLIARQRRALAGDSTVLASNWAQVYVNLSEEARRAEAQERVQTAAALLDTALVWDDAYVPALLSYAALHRDAGQFVEAARWLDRAQALDPEYAPTYAARAALEGAQARAGGRTDGALDVQVGLLQQALQLERDLSERADLNRTLRELYLAHARLPEAIRTAEAYVADAPTISTYLRDRRDEAAAFAHALRASAGYAGETLPFFRELVGQKPQNYELRTQYADALLLAGQLQEAEATLEEAQRILRAAGTPRADFASRVGHIRLLRGDTAGARDAIAPILDGTARSDAADLRLVRVLTSLGQATEANLRLQDVPVPSDRPSRAEHAFTRGWMAQWRGDREEAERLYREAVETDPYAIPARMQLIALLREDGRSTEANALLQDADQLPLPLGPALQREVAR